MSSIFCIAGKFGAAPAIFGLARSRALADECLQRAHSALEHAGIRNSLLGGIAEWVVARKN